MPQNKFALARYQIIDTLLRKNEYVKTSFMAEQCSCKTGYSVSQRTIQMDVEAMKSDTFLAYYAPIDYDSKRKAYFYKDQSYSLQPFSLTKEEVSLLEGLAATLNEHHRKRVPQLLSKLRLLINY